MTKRIGTVAMSLAVLTTLSAEATEASRVVTITSILPVSTSRPGDPNSQNLIRVYFNAGSFGSTSCRTDAADIAVEDWHLYTTIMSGWRDNRVITMYVDDTSRLVPADASCRIVAVRIA